MAKFCPNCGNEVLDNSDVCLKCGVGLKSNVVNNNGNVSKNSNGMAIAGFILSFLFSLLGLIFSIIGLKKAKETNSGRGLSIAGIVISSIRMVVGLFIAIIFGIFVFYEINESYDAPDSSSSSIFDLEINKHNSDTYELGDTIKFDGLEIVFDDTYSFVTINNNFSEFNNSDVIKIGANIKNISEEKNGFKMYYCSLFGSKGTELENVSFYFDESVDDAGDLKPGASYYKYFYLLYDGDGEYSIDFDNFSEEFSLSFNVTK